MGKEAKILILGITVGAVGIALALRLRSVLESRDPHVLADRIADDLRQLETRLGSR
jgi:hypothetical protein